MSNSPTAWFTFLFGKQINSTTPVNPVCNIEKSIYFYQVIYKKKKMLSILKTYCRLPLITIKTFKFTMCILFFL